MTNRRYRLFDGYDVISFDMFDTLITRNLDKPSEMFDLVQKQIRQLGIDVKRFKSKRINAEYQARMDRGYEGQDITLDSIYEVIGNCYDLDNETIEQIKNVEIEIEESICEINREGYKLYQYCIKKSKKIIICTDMYLPKQVIERILSNNKITYCKLYLSNDIGYSKAFKGELFRYVIHDLDINRKQILHIGDNWKNDILHSRLNGIKSLHLSTKNYCTIHDGKNKEIEYKILNHYINNHIKTKKDYYWKTGYQVLGPILYGFSIWLSENIRDYKPDKVFFLSRDGFIMQQAFNILSPDIENKYIYASRKALIIPTLWMYRNLESIVRIMKFPRWVKMVDFLTRMGLEPHKYELSVMTYGYQMDSLINVEAEIKNPNFRELWDSIFQDIEKISLESYENTLRYFKDIGLNGKVAIIDIGWNGNLQQAMEQIINAAKIDAEIQGYYLGVQVDSDIQDKYKMKGFLFQKKYNEIICQKLTFCRSLMETFFVAEHGSVKGYGRNGIEFQNFEYENTKSLQKIKKIQEGALSFVKDFSNYSFSRYFYIDSRTAITNFFILGNQPRQEDVENMGQILFLDDELKNLIPQVSRRKYYFNIFRFIHDLKFSVWITGLLKKVCFVNVDFFYIAMKLRNIYYGKSDSRKKQ